MLIARTPVRISFFGGGTDFPVYYENHGGAVLSTTINKFFYTILTQRDDNRIQIISSDFRTIEAWDRVPEIAEDPQTELALPFAVIQWLKCEAGLNLFLASEIPPGTGLGSSAAVCVNLLHILSFYLQRVYSRSQMAENAFRIARDVLKKPVGKQDEYASAFGGLNCITFQQTGTHVERIPLPPAFLRELEESMLLFYTGEAHDSWTILKEQERSSARTEGQTVQSLHCLKELVFEGRDALLAGNFFGFGTLLDRAWTEKKKLSSRVSNPHLDAVYELAKSNGAVGGKIAGAGGGGFMLFYCEKKAQEQLITAMKSAGLRQMHFGFDQAGSQIIYDDPFFATDRQESKMWSYVPGELILGKGLSRVDDL